MDVAYIRWMWHTYDGCDICIYDGCGIHVMDDQCYDGRDIDMINVTYRECDDHCYV